MTTISCNGSKGHHKFTMDVVEIGTPSIANNTSQVRVTLKISSLGGTWDWYDYGTNIKWSVTVNSTSCSGYIPNYDGNSTTALVSKDVTVAHADDGTKTIGFSFSVSDSSGTSYTCGNASSNGSMTLATIPRYTSITQMDVTAKSETQINIKFAMSDLCSKVWYSTNNGANWLEITLGGSGAKSGSTTIGSLSANTTYQVKLKVRRKDSGLDTVSHAVSQTTYDYPHITKVKTVNLSIGSSQTLTIYNPLSRTVTVKANKDSASGIQLFNATTNTTSLAFTMDSDTLYASIPNSKNGNVVYSIIYGTIKKSTSVCTYNCVESKCKPTSLSISYADINAATVEVTENDQDIIRNKSKLQFTVGAIAKNGASISSYSVTCDGKIAKLVSGKYEIDYITAKFDTTAILTVTDSRGFTNTKEITIAVLDYFTPYCIADAKRLNNYEDDTTLRASGNVAYLNGHNSVDLSYKYRIVNDAYWSGEIAISNNIDKQHVFPKDNAYEIQFIIRDVFESSTYTVILQKGVPIMFIDTGMLSISIGGFPSHSESFETFGDMYVNGEKVTVDPFKLLWSGNLNTGTITVPNLSKYTMFYIVCTSNDNDELGLICHYNNADGTIMGGSGYVMAHSDNINQTALRIRAIISNGTVMVNETYRGFAIGGKTNYTNSSHKIKAIYGIQ